MKSVSARPSRLRAFSRRCVPAAFDAWIVLTAWWCLVAAATSTLLAVPGPFAPIQVLLPAVSMLTAIVVAMAVIASGLRVSRTMALLLLLSVAAGSAWAYYYQLRLNRLFAELYEEYDFRSRDPFDSATFVEAYGWSFWTIIVGWLLISIGPRFAKRFNGGRRFVDSILTFLNRHRLRIMIGFLVIMIPGMIIRNIIDPDRLSPPLVLMSVFLAGLALLAFVVLLWATKIVLNKRWIGVTGSLLVLAACGWLVSVMVNLSLNDDWRSDSCLIDVGVPLGAMTFVLAIFVLIADQPDRTRSRLFSLWTPLLLLIALGGPLSLIRRYDPDVFAIGLVMRWGEWDFAELTDAAEQSREMIAVTDGAARLFVDEWQHGVAVSIRHTGDAEALTKLYRKYPQLSTALVVLDINPAVETSSLPVSIDHVGVVGGELSERQLLDFSAVTSSFAVLEVQLPVENVSKASVPRLWMGGEKGCTRLPEFLDAFVPNGLREVRIQSPVDQEDWRAFARHSDACHFGLYNFQRQAASFPKEFFASGELYGVSLFCYDADHPGQLLPFLGSGVQLLAPPVRDGQAFWDYCFIGIEPSRSRRWIDSNKAFLEQATDYHWAFGWHPDGTISEIWLPTIELVLQNQSALDSVRTLRMDREGIVAFNELLARDVSALATLQSLERLYLDRQQYIDSFGFLAQLGELRHLQIQAKGRTSSDTAGFDECENLETVRFFGAPDPQTIRELATLPKLRRVEIVDENAEFDKPKTRADLRERLPMVNVSFISVDDYEADIGPQLREHLSSTGAEIIRRFERMGATR